MKIKNNSNNIQVVVWIPKFLPNEEREVENETWLYLLKNPNFTEVKIKETKKTEKSKSE